MGKIKVHAWDILRMIPDEEIAKIAKKPISGSHHTRRMGIHSPSSGHPQNKRWATSARTAGNECPYVGLILGKRLHKGGMKENIKILRVT